MKYLLLFLFSIFLLSGFSQKLKEKTVINYNEGFREEFSVLKKDKSIKHGPYKSTWVNGNPKEEGYFSFGQKDSIWKFFNSSKAIIQSRGEYEQGNRIGLWEYFDYKGTLLQEYNHSTKVLSFNKAKDTIVRHNIQVDSILTEVRLQHSPIYLGGDLIRKRVIQNEITYPQEAVDLNIYGTVWISFFVDPDGKTVEYEIFKRIGGGCDEEALRVIKLIPDNWVPGVYEGSTVKVQLLMPITFVLN